MIPPARPVRRRDRARPRRAQRARPSVDVTDLHQAERADFGSAVLVRPDGYIAWAGDSADCSEWLAALARWAAPVEHPRVVPANACLAAIADNLEKALD